MDNYAGNGLQRYYIQGGTAVTGLFEEVLSGVKSWFYAHEDGTVVRGKWDNGAGRIYLADNEGHLASLGSDGCGSGWLVTGAYDGGGLQRYYIDGASHAAVSGYFTVDASRLHAEGGPGESYFGVDGEGYVLRGTGRGVRNDWLVADNDGKLAKYEWVVTSVFGQGLQRYWIEGISGQAGYFGAKTGFFSVGGTDYYGRSEGYVLRGGLVVNGQFVYANNDGVILDRSKVINAIVDFMVKIANDDSHGYTQGENRWGQPGDYDCSALVITALRHADLDTGAADNTRNMRQELTKLGFEWVTDFSSLQKGDILLWEGVHTAMYLGDGLIAHAVSNEFGGILGGAPGDQTGREIRIQSYDSYQKRWTGILRLK